MNKIEIQSLIDRVIGKKGNLKTPAWWMRKLLNEIIDWIQKKEDDIKVLEKSIEFVKAYNLPYIILRGKGSITVDSKIISIDSEENVEVSYVDTFSLEQKNVSNITYVNLNNASLRKMTDLSSLLKDNSKLSKIILSHFDTSAVTNMSYMFAWCSGLTTLDLSHFDTSALLNYGLGSTFYKCSSLTNLILGPNFFKINTTYAVDFSYLTKWNNETVVTSLVTNLYDRAANGLSTLTLKLSANTKAALNNEQKAYITSKGYTIS